MNDSKSSALFAKAKALIPGGVNSPVRAFKSVGRDPLFIARAAGSKIYDVDGNAYIDYVFPDHHRNNIRVFYPRLSGKSLPYVF